MLSEASMSNNKMSNNNLIFDKILHVNYSTPHPNFL